MSDIDLYPIENNFTTRLATKAASGDATITVQATITGTFTDDFEAIIEPGTTNAEPVKVTAVSSTTWTVTRGQPRYDGDAGSAITHPAGSTVVISDSFGHWDAIKTAVNTKVDNTGDTMTGKLQFSGTTHAGLQFISLTTTERLALTPVNGDMVYDETLGQMWQYTGGTWSSVDTGTSTGAATTTALGTGELSTAVETDAGASTGSVGPLIATPDLIAGAVQDASWVYAADAEASDTYVIVLTPAIAAYATGQIFHFKANTANTGAATLNVNAKGAKTIKKHKDQDLETNDIEAGQIVTVMYDGTNFQMQSQLATPMTTAQGDTLTDGSNADSLHIHEYNKRLNTTTADVAISSSTTETDLVTFSLPANTLGTNNVVQGKLYISSFEITNGQTCTLRLKYGATTLVSIALTKSEAVSFNGGIIDFSIMGSGATNTQDGSLYAAMVKNGTTLNLPSTIGGTVSGTAAEDSTGALTLVVTAQMSNSSASDRITMSNAYVQVID